MSKPDDKRQRTPPQNLSPRPGLLYKTVGVAGDPAGAREPHHHVFTFLSKNRAWMVCGYSAGRPEIERRKQQAWTSLGIPAEIGFPEIDFEKCVTFFRRESQGHRTVLDVEAVRSRPIADLRTIGHPSGEMNDRCRLRVLQAVYEYAEWVDRNWSNLQRLNPRARRDLASEIVRLRGRAA